ncbi:MAG: hypothetical protein FWH15_05355 [Betaproteobacteria bacterium]|nr:hypothetical protein [Betaproteobacteria bacterium]
MSRSPWEHRPALLAPLTPEEEQEVLAKALKYKPRLIISRWIARVVSAAFFVWFILGLFSVHLVVMFSLNSIPKLAMACAFPHLLPIGFANVQRDKIAGFEKLNRDNDIAILNRRALAESTSLWLLHGVIAVVAIFSQL